MFRDQSMHINEKLPNVHGNVLFLRVEQWRIQDFPLGGGGHQPPMRTLFSENVCENERNGSCWGGRAPAAPPPLDPPMLSNQKKSKKQTFSGLHLVQNHI